MQRSTNFISPARQPLLDHPRAQLRHDKVKGPLPFLNPTSATFDLVPKSERIAQATDTLPSSPEEKIPPQLGEAQLKWRARDNRKGRHVLVVPRKPTTAETPKPTATWSAVGKGLWRMCSEYAWWDVSWWIAVVFSAGSAIFVASGFFYWLPLEAPNTEFTGEGSIAGGVTAFIGATLFQVGAILLIFEACNENQSGCFGWALEQAFSLDHSDENETHKEANTMQYTATDYCEHHHLHGLHKKSAVQMQHPGAGRTWEWWPTWHELTTHYFHEIGFLASIALSIGSTIFYISGIMALPGIYDSLSQAVLWGVYWLAYLSGSIFFLVSSVLYMLETQPKWYKPAPQLLGWWIGVFNGIGAVGWTLSASLGYCSASWCEYQGELSLLWASIAYLIGSLLLWYEALEKYPVERASK
ncbi:hypothetical protein LTR37_004526 [Vermiconidia calcicola]|uniref:Uncharacterized protein n=1 Tax=Vermiconidia calcicola TaxID=1690605 RepID=A0ACC3NN04_9PEZI|nr:hypothetical protein LTR37_004526 [Vermiconidia calcicola]